MFICVAVYNLWKTCKMPNQPKDTSFFSELCTLIVWQILFSDESLFQQMRFTWSRICSDNIECLINHLRLPTGFFLWNKQEDGKKPKNCVPAWLCCWAVLVCCWILHHFISFSRLLRWSVLTAARQRSAFLLSELEAKNTHSKQCTTPLPIFLYSFEIFSTWLKDSLLWVNPQIVL